MNLNQLLQQSGQFPPLSLKIVPLDRSKFANLQYGMEIKTFVDYRFKASVVQPVADFSFTFANPSQTYAFTSYVREGDIAIVVITVNKQEYTLATGIIDTIETEVSAAGEIITVMGRDLLGQLDDQGVFTPDGSGLWASSITPQQMFALLQESTRIQRFRMQGIPSQAFKVGMVPMESKLQVLVRYLEPYNGLVWSDPDGTLVMGKPNMAQDISGTIIVNREKGISNCISIRSTRSAATIPNVVLPILSAQTNVARQVAKQQQIFNPAIGPSRLLSLGHRLTRVFCVSDPDGNAPQQLNAAQSISITGGVLSRCRSYGLREIAKENMRELAVQSVMPGHLNESALPYRIDQVYTVNFDRDGIDEKMYAYELEYTLTAEEGPRTLLNFTRMNTIVGGIAYQ